MNLVLKYTHRSLSIVERGGSVASASLSVSGSRLPKKKSELPVGDGPGRDEVLEYAVSFYKVVK